MAAVIESLARGENLSADAASAAFSRLMDGELSASQAGALLLGLRAKGETPEEVSEAALAVLARAVPVPPVLDDCIDIVGTGGDGKFSFNCSTATSLTLAGMGHKVLKHGNRSVSSRCGSADVLEQLGLPLDTPPESVPRALRVDGFVFLFAPRYHPAFQHVMPVRRELGVRTLFNLLGPLVNPARPTRHFLGVADSSQLPLVAETLARVSPGSGAVVCGAGGYDELTTLGEARLVFVEKGTTRPGRLDPAEYGFKPCSEQDLAVAGPEHAAAVLRELLRGEGPEAMREMLVLNLAFALYLVKDGPRGEDDGDCGYDRGRMSRMVLEARRAVAEGAGRRFCRA
jgi:anthranilate phosphoribosyltransferase